AGNKQTLVVGIASAATAHCSPGCPTENVANTSKDFMNNSLLFDTEDGIVAGWNGVGNAAIVIDNSSASAVYKGLALVSNNEGNFLLGGNLRTGGMDVFDNNFKHAPVARGRLTDPGLPAGFAAHCGPDSP